MAAARQAVVLSAGARGRPLAHTGTAASTARATPPQRVDAQIIASVDRPTMAAPPRKPPWVDRSEGYYVACLGDPDTGSIEEGLGTRTPTTRWPPCHPPSHASTASRSSTGHLCTTTQWGPGRGGNGHRWRVLYASTVRPPPRPGSNQVRRPSRSSSPSAPTRSIAKSPPGWTSVIIGRLRPCWSWQWSSPHGPLQLRPWSRSRRPPRRFAAAT